MSALARAPAANRNARPAMVSVTLRSMLKSHSFTFSLFNFFPEYQWLDSYLDVAPQIVAFAWPERQPLLTAIGLLLVSSSVSLSIPFVVRKLIDYFTSVNPVGHLLDTRRRIGSHRFYPPTDDSPWFLTDPSHCWCFSCFLQLEVFAKRDAPFSCACLVRCVKDFSKRPFHLVPWSANSCSSARTNLCCNPSTRS